MKKLIIPIILSTTLLLSSFNIAQATYNPVSDYSCDLAVYPFDSSKTPIIGSAANTYINQINDVCDNYVEYPNAYSPQPPSPANNPLKNNAEGKNLPITAHDHIYYNNTVHDDYYYKAFVDKFEITLESDGKNSIDINNIECQTPYPSGFNIALLAAIEDCSGTVNSLWGGTTVTKEILGNSVKITWDFAEITGPGPIVWANNGASFSEGDYTDKDDRKIEFSVHLPSKDNDEIWSATTSSRTLLADLYIKKTNYAAHKNDGCYNDNVNHSNSGWCYITPAPDFETETVFTTTNRTFYWFPIGSISSVWREPPPEQAICSELNIVPTNLEANEAGEITITVKDTDAANLPGNTIINVVNTAGGTLTNKNGAEVINTTKINKFPLNYSGGEDGTIIFTIDNSSEYYSASCTDSVQVGEAVCSELLVDHYDPVYEDVVSTFAAQAKDGIFFMDDKIDYSVIPPVAPGEDVEYGYFYTSKPANSELTQDVSNAEYIKEIIIDFYWSSLSLILDYYPVVNEIDLGASLNKNLLLGLATGFDMAEDGTFKVDESLKAPSKEDLSITDPDLFMTDTDSLKFKESPEILKWFLLANQVEADPVETVYFLGEKPGEQVVEIQPVDNSEAVCLRKFDVEPLCKELQVNYEGDETSALEAEVQHELIYENRLTHFEASGLTWKDDDFSGRITYSVDSGYGTFYTYKPAGKILNSTMDNVATVQEFNASGIDISYYDQLCEDPEKPTFEKSKTDVFKKGVPEFLKNVYFENNNFKFEDAIVPKKESSIIKIMDDYKFIKMEDYKNLKIDPLPPVTKATDSKSLQASLITLIPDPNTIIINEDLILDHGFGSEVQSGNMITVDPGQKVWFFAEKEGDDVIHVSANCANSETCVRHFDIIGFPVCGELTLNKVNFEANEAGEISIDSLEDINGNSIDETVEINVTKTATGELTDKNNVVINDGDTITTDQFPVNYAGGESGEITFTIDSGSEYYSESCSASIEVGVVAVCNSLEVEPPSFEANDAGNISITVKDENNDNLAADTIIDIANTADGTLTGADSAEVTNTATISQFPLSYSGGESGEITFTIDSDSEYYAESCTDSVAIGVSQSCESLALTITEHNGAGVTKLTNNKVYFVNANASFSSEASAEDQEVTLTMNSSFGAFIEAADLENAATAASNMADNEELNDSTINNAPGLTTTNTITLTGDNTDQVLLVTYNNSADMASALSAYVTNFQEDCSQTVEYDGVEEEIACIDLTIDEPNSPWEADTDSNKEHELFKIKVEASNEDKKDDLTIVWETEKGTWYEYDDTTYKDKGKNFESQGEYNYFLGDLDELENNTKVTIYAKDFEEVCTDSIQYKKPDEKTPEDPEFKKRVYSDNPEDVDSTLNLGSKADGEKVNFFIEFKPGSETETVKITDNAITDDESIKGNHDGTLKFEENAEISIKAEKKNEGNLSAMPITIKDCDDSETVCIEDMDNALLNFKKGKAIEFKNANQTELGNDGRITITYTMTLSTLISNNTCASLNKEDGCGEIFENEAEYETNKNKTGKDSTKVIVICPYVLTRAGGDAFFYDLIETGVDVSYCSEVESCEGVCITPDPEKDADVTKTGASGDGEVYLTAPSHDICTFSNDPGNVIGYNNVLENFSSTICELKADVAEEWQELFINKAIKANVERVARWEYNLLTNTHQPESASGVFVREGDYRIENYGNENEAFIIEEKNGTPAAQTYIIKGGNLEIYKDIKYGSTDGFSDPTKIPSVAFIVIDGNIIIGEAVTELHGVYMAVDTDNKDDDGQVMTISADGKVIGKSSTNQLTIYGNLFGNVNELFKNRTFAGDPMKDEGSVTIHYDERILLNTPPVIGELIDIQQAIVPN